MLESPKGLLISSYLFSAHRITEALAGRLSIRNSREPGDPRAKPGRVVGLCGQGGRHPYFEIPRDALDTALDKIAKLLSSLKDGLFLRSRSSPSLTIDSGLDQMAAICEELRRRTWFKDSTLEMSLLNQPLLQGRSAQSVARRSPRRPHPRQSRFRIP